MKQVQTFALNQFHFSIFQKCSVCMVCFSRYVCIIYDMVFGAVHVCVWGAYFQNIATSRNGFGFYTFVQKVKLLNGLQFSEKVSTTANFLPSAQLHFFSLTGLQKMSQR